MRYAQLPMWDLCTLQDLEAKHTGMEDTYKGPD